MRYKILGIDECGYETFMGEVETDNINKTINDYWQDYPEFKTIYFKEIKEVKH